MMYCTKFNRGQRQNTIKVNQSKPLSWIFKNIPVHQELGVNLLLSDVFRAQKHVMVGRYFGVPRSHAILEICQKREQCSRKLRLNLKHVLKNHSQITLQALPPNITESISPPTTYLSPSNFQMTPSPNSYKKHLFFPPSTKYPSPVEVLQAR